MTMRGSLATDEGGAERADSQCVQCRRRRRLDHGVGGEPQVIVVGETDEMAAIDLDFTPQGVDRREKWVTEVKISLPREPEALRCIIGEALGLLHLLDRRSRWVHETIGKSGILLAATWLPLPGRTGCNLSMSLA